MKRKICRRNCKKKSLTHQEFNELCENILHFLEYGPWPEWEDISILEQVLVMTAEQAISLMPLSIFEYDALNEFDKWQEMYGDDDNPELDDAINEIFTNPDCRKLIADYVRNGEYTELAGDIGIE